MKRWTLLLLTAGCATVGKTAPFQMEDVVEQTVLTGPEGIRVEIAQSREDALIRITGVGNELEGMVLPAQLQGDISRRYYITQIDGRENRTIHRVDDQWTLYAHTGSGVKLSPDPGAELDLKGLLKTHDQQADALARLREFDDEAARREGQDGLVEEISDDLEACSIQAEVTVNYENITEAQLMKYSIRSYCENGANGLKRACRVPKLKDFLSSQVKRYECAFGEEMGLELDGETLRFTTAFESPNQGQWAREALDRLPLPTGRTLGRARVEHDSAVCKAPDRDLYVVIGSNDSEAFAGISYGTQQTLYRQPKRPFLPDGWFFEPRFPNPQHNENFRGYDLRVFSYVSVSDEGECTLKCGTREIPLEVLLPADKESFLASAQFEPLPDPREPYGLARDRRGTYYYVDRGATPVTQKDFRLYVGRPGRLKLQKMRDIVSDSEGEIFSSPRGALKLYLSKEKAEWSARGRTRDLLRVPIRENFGLIYGELGVYLGQKLHTPCDDL